MDERTLDARVARLIMGWRPRIVRDWPAPSRDGNTARSPDVPRYTSDPAADYEVLRRVRETWSYALNVEFARQLERTWKDRLYAGTIGPFSNWACCYQPGDYARAALKTLELETQQMQYNQP